MEIEENQNVAQNQQDINFIELPLFNITTNTLKFRINYPVND
jgi:hypothetical protein